MRRKLLALFVALAMIVGIFPFTGVMSFATEILEYDDYYLMSSHEVDDVVDPNRAEVVAHVENFGETPVKLKIKVFSKDGTELTAQANYYETYFLESQKTVEQGGSEWIEAPFKTIVTAVNKYQEENCLVLEYVVKEFDRDWYDANAMNEGNLIVDGSVTPYISNESEDTVIDFNIEIYSDDSYETLVAEKSFTIQPGNSCGDEAYFSGVEQLFYGRTLTLHTISYRKNDTVNSDGLKEGTLTYKFVDASYLITEERKEELAEFESGLKEILNSCGTEYTAKIADPAVFEDEWYGKDEAVAGAFADDGLILQFGIDRTLRVEDKIKYYLEPKYYKDAELTEEIGLSETEPGVPFYISLGYGGTYRWDDVYVNSSVRADNAITATYTFEDVDENSAEVKKIKENLEKGLVEISYDDLAWINVLAFVGYDPKMPGIGHAGSMLKNRTPDLYEDLVGETALDLKVAFGGFGASFEFSKMVGGNTAYFVDDVFYRLGNETFIYMINSVYVAENSIDRAAAAEIRIKDYMGDNDYDVDVTELNSADLAEFVVEEFGCDESTVAAYMTEYGVALYKNSDNTGKSGFIGLMPFGTADVFANGNLEQNGTLQYVDVGDEGKKRNVNAYKAYKLELGEASYLYVIGTKPENELENPFANWEDQDTGIITEGKNGQVVGDFYTKIHRTSDGDIEVIKKELKGNAGKVEAYDIVAFTNFKDGKITDLGDGRVQIMVPFDSKKMDKDNLKVFYYNDNSKKVEEELPFELIPNADAPEYVCFTVSHFSTYGIAEVSDGGSGGNDNAGNTGDADNSGKTEADKDSEANTGDDFSPMLAAIAGLLALAAFGTTMFVRRRNS